MDNTAFDDAYWLSQPIEIREFRTLPPADSAAREKLAQELARFGFAIDLEIMVWGWEPYSTMFMRKKYGFTWVPAANQPGLNLVPNEPFANTDPMADRTPYDPKHPPAGAIRVSTDIAAYPPLNPPAPKQPEPMLANFVGSDSGGGFFRSLKDDPTPDGQTVTDARGIFVMHRIWGLGSLESRWYTIMKKAA